MKNIPAGQILIFLAQTLPCVTAGMNQVGEEAQGAGDAFW